MLEDNPFRSLIRRIRAGDEAAAAELVRNYEPVVRRAARLRLVDSRLQCLFDSLDISQSVFASFFLRAALGQYELDRPEQLLNLLLNMSRKKLVDHARRQGAARRDYRRGMGELPEHAFISPEPDPVRQVAARELLQNFRKRLTEEECRLVDLRAAGHNWNQIAAEEGKSADTLRKKLARAVNRVAADLGLDWMSDE
jgi:RNA polymerase sigma-70 factor (ECF subfamily)